MKETGSTISVQANDTKFGECLKLPYYCGSVENWMVATNGFLIAINLASVLITITANTTFLVTYFKTRSLRTPHYFFLMLLALTDISVGLISQPLFVARKIMEIYSIQDCVVWTAMRATVYYFSGLSFLTITLVSIERYFAVCKPIKHRNTITQHRMAMVASIVWLVWLAFPILRFVFSEFYKFFGMLIGAIIIALFAINAFIYVKIKHCVSGKHLRVGNTNEPPLRKTRSEKDLEKEARLAKTVACLMLVMILAYLPTAIGLAYKAMVGVDTTYMFVFLPIADTLVLINSSFNPLFYCYKNKNIRVAIKKCFRDQKTPTKCTSSSLDCMSKS